nr:FecR family protein [uncultured Chitinophaga sp.]
MSIQQFKDIIDRLLEGTASEEETLVIQRWLQQTDDTEVVLSGEERASLMREMRAQIAAGTGIPMPQTKVIQPIWWRYAAAVAAVVTATSLFFFTTRQRQKTTLAAAVRYFKAPPGQLKKVLLTDSSTVYLFPGAALHVPENYGSSDRLLQLEGRAFFDVKPDPGKVFSVRTGRLLTTVLGTSFEVKAADRDARTTITVQTGKVHVQYGSRHLSDVERGLQLVYDSSRADYTLAKVTADDTLGWINGTLSFHQMPLSAVCLTVEDWFKTKIVIRNKKWEKEKVTANLNGQSLDTTMQILSQTLGFKYEKVQELIIIY